MAQPLLAPQIAHPAHQAGAKPLSVRALGGLPLLAHRLNALPQPLAHLPVQRNEGAADMAPLASHHRHRRLATRHERDLPLA